MNTLGQIIDKLEKKYEITIHGECHENDFIKGIRFLSNDDIQLTYLTPNLLYLADYSQFKDVTVYGNILFVNTALPLKEEVLYIKENIDLFDLYNTISDLLSKYDRIIQSKQALFSVLHAGNGLDDLLRTAYRFLENPIIVLDTSYTILNSFPLIEDIDNDGDFTVRHNRTSIKKEYVDNMKNEKLSEEIMHSLYPFSKFISRLGYTCIFESIRIQHSVVGYIFIRCVNKEISDDELEYIHILAQMISVQLQKDDTYQNPFALQHDIFFKNLLSSHFDTQEEIKQAIIELKMKPQTKYFFIVSGFVDVRHKRLPSNYYWIQLNSIFRNALTNIDGNYFITLVSSNDYNKYLSSIKTRFDSFLKMNLMKAAISYSFTNLLHANIYASQAIEQLKYNLIRYDENVTYNYSEFYFTHLFYLSNRQDEMKASIHPAIKLIYRYDKKKKTEYLKTLTTYLKCNRNAPETAKVLFIHKSTLFYRFSKMKDLFHINLEDSDDLFSYEYSIKLLSLLNE
jgi:sugar diacid utilization regulator